MAKVQEMVSLARIYRKAIYVVGTIAELGVSTALLRFRSIGFVHKQRLGRGRLIHQGKEGRVTGKSMKSISVKWTRRRWFWTGNLNFILPIMISRLPDIINTEPVFIAEPLEKNWIAYCWARC